MHKQVKSQGLVAVYCALSENFTTVFYVVFGAANGNHSFNHEGI